jgi:hypothetical protein
MISTCSVQLDLISRDTKRTYLGRKPQHIILDPPEYIRLGKRMQLPDQVLIQLVLLKLLLQIISISASPVSSFPAVKRSGLT